jgi:hypothetical protein
MMAVGIRGCADSGRYAAEDEPAKAVSRDSMPRLRPELRFVIATLGLLAALPAGASAQGLVVRGRVYDPTSGNAGIENATVTLARQRATLSDRDGTFVFRGVPRGEHSLRIEALGYEELELSLTLVGDTTLTLPMKRRPIGLGGVGVVLERIDFDGRVRDPATNAWVSGAEVTSDQGHQERSNLFGRFDLDDVFDGPPLRVLIRAFRYLPLDTTFIPDDEDRRSFDLVPDPVIDRIIGAYVAGLDERAERHLYNEYRMPLNRQDLASLRPNTTLREVLERKYSLRQIRSIGCMFLDELEHRFMSEEHRNSVFEGTFANDIERIELLEFPEAGSMLRVYTRYFFQSHVGSTAELRRPLMVATPYGVLCG